VYLVKYFGGHDVLEHEGLPGALWFGNLRPTRAREQANHIEFVGLHHYRDEFHVLDARQSDFDHVPWCGVDPPRAGANTAED
jgi:hypothetical protein